MLATVPVAGDVVVAAVDAVDDEVAFRVWVALPDWVFVFDVAAAGVVDEVVESPFCCTAKKVYKKG